jgi:flagellar biogenesis protein FliO
MIDEKLVTGTFYGLPHDSFWRRVLSVCAVSRPKRKTNGSLYTEQQHRQTQQRVTHTHTHTERHSRADDEQTESAQTQTEQTAPLQNILKKYFIDASSTISVTYYILKH